MRCPSCDAAVPADAAWCTLCFARLRSEAAPAAPLPAPTPAPTPAPPVAAPVAPPVPPLAPAVPVAPAAPAATTVLDAPAPTWPCSSCDARVPLEETSCPLCGTAFMGGVNPNVSLKVPGVGDLVSMSPGGRFGVMAGGAAVVATVLLLLFLLLGHIF